MKVSIITSTYNNKQTIGDAIESVANQTYEDIEYVVVDGASSDGTVEVIQAYKDDIATFVSAPDRGVYDGLNKGVSLATGDVVSFLHSDDLYASETIVASIAEEFKKDSALDGVYGDLIYTPKDDTSKVLRYWKI
jgi:glycosyltransferase